MPKILVVDDSEGQSAFLVELLESERYLVDVVRDGEEAIQQLRLIEYDLIILDWQLPKFSGIEVCKEYRSCGGTSPVIILTGKASDADKELGLDSGADDYVTKPYGLKEMSARVRAHLRRSTSQRGNTLSVLDIVLDVANFTVQKSGIEINLLPKEFALLEFFMRNPDRVFSSDELMRRIWDTDSESSNDALRTTMRRLRQKLGADGDNSIIENVHGVGYRMRSK